MSRAPFRVADASDAATLADLGRETFRETFVEGFAVPYTAADVATYYAETFTAEAIARTMEDPRLRWWIAFDGERPIGFAEAGPCVLPHPEASKDHGELKKIYFLRSHQNAGLGRPLFAECLAWLGETFGAAPLWIGVWNGNEKAQRFYRRAGFEQVGEYYFPVGETRDHELIFRR
jgi:RimJ/RimL family protein N-acetyltransferase